MWKRLYQHSHVAKSKDRKLTTVYRHVLVIGFWSQQLMIRSPHPGQRIMLQLRMSWRTYKITKPIQIVKHLVKTIVIAVRGSNL